MNLREDMEDLERKMDHSSPMRVRRRLHSREYARHHFARSRLADLSLRMELEMEEMDELELEEEEMALSLYHSPLDRHQPQRLASHRIERHFDPPEMHNTAGSTPLHFATVYGHYDVVKLLVERGVIIDVQNSAGNTALHLAAMNGHERVVAYLLSQGADASLYNGAGRTPEAEARYRGHNEVADTFLSRI